MLILAVLRATVVLAFTYQVRSFFLIEEANKYVIICASRVTSIGFLRKNTQILEMDDDNSQKR